MYPNNPRLNPTRNPQQIQAEKEAKKNLRPQDMFLGETNKYSAFDEDGALRFCFWGRVMDYCGWYGMVMSTWDSPMK